MWGNSLRRFDEPEKEIPELTKEAENCVILGGDYLPEIVYRSKQSVNDENLEIIESRIPENQWL